MKKSLYSKKAISNSFSRASSSYDFFSHVQRLSNEKLLELLPEGFYQDVLEIGIGTGGFTKSFIKKIDFKRLLAVDLSYEMLKKAKDSLQNKSNIQFLCCDAEKMAIKREFKVDLILSSSSFHWFHNLDSAIFSLRRHLKPKGALICSIFGQHSLKELQTVVNKYSGNTVYLPTSFFPKEIYLKRALATNFNTINFEKMIIKKAYPDLMTLLLSLKKTGVTPKNNRTRPLFKTKKAIKKADELYRELFGDITASFEIFFFYACI